MEKKYRCLYNNVLFTDDYGRSVTLSKNDIVTHDHNDYYSLANRRRKVSISKEALGKYFTREYPEKVIDERTMLRNNAAVAAMSALLGHSKENPETTAKLAVSYADALVVKLYED